MSASIKLEMDAAPMIALSDIDLVALYRGLAGVDAIVSLDWWRFLRVDATEVFTYRFRASDGREWKQTIDFTASATDPVMTFDVSPGWKLTEFSSHRSVRDLAVKIHGRTTLAALRATFT